ncbi:MAG: hypothetical protein J2P50_13060 [Hyphomicrobiaceae bacterium]|nr:hypothetical protein [Hyphomicrobiaceae bacterium]
MLSLLGLVAVTQSDAQQAPPQIPDEVVRRMIELGLKNIQRGLCGGLDGCAPATPEEFELPPITIPQARIAVVVGTQSALARWCGLDADRRSVAPMLRQIRQKMRFNERQVALMAVIHGIQQSIVTDGLKARGECNEATRRDLDAQLPKD